MSTSSQAPRTKPPQQSRSEETLRRFLEAAESLLDQGTFDDVSIAEIARLADRSVGAFYARFENKEALFAELRRRTLTVLSNALDQYVETSDWRPLDLEQRVRQLMETMVDLYTRHRGVMRALALRARAQTDRELVEQSPGINEGIYRQVVAVLDDCLDHPDEAARLVKVRFAVSVGAAALREHILFDEIGLSPVGIDRDGLAEELTRVLVSYLSHLQETPCSTSRERDSS